MYNDYQKKLIIETFYRQWEKQGLATNNATNLEQNTLINPFLKMEWIGIINILL